MTAYRALVALAALITALLIQTTVIGPIVLAVPASVMLVLVLSAALLAGPATGIGFGFSAGLLADLTSTHPVGLLALTWLAGGLCAGVLGGLVAARGAAGSVADVTGTGVGRRRGRRNRPRRRLSTVRFGQRCLLIGVLGAATSAVSAVLAAALATTRSEAHDPLLPDLARCLPAGVVDAAFAVVVLPWAAVALHSAALRTRSQHRAALLLPPTLPMTMP